MEAYKDIEQKSELILQLKRIEDQLESLFSMGETLCERDCEVTLQFGIVDPTKQTEQTREDVYRNYFGRMMGTDNPKEDSFSDQHSDSVEIDLADNSIIKLVGYLVEQLQEEKHAITKELNK